MADGFREMDMCDILIIDESDLELAVEVSDCLGIDLVGGVIYSPVTERDWEVTEGLADIQDLCRNFDNYLVARVPRHCSGNRYCLESLDEAGLFSRIEAPATVPEPIKTPHLWPSRQGFRWMRTVSDRYGFETNLDIAIDEDDAVLICRPSAYGPAPAMLEEYIEFHRSLERPFDLYKNRDLKQVYENLIRATIGPEGEPIVPDQEGINEIRALLNRGKDEAFWSLFE